jgi:hypothetical protein
VTFMWIAWAMLIGGFPFTFILALGSGLGGHPWPGALLLGLLAAFACDGAVALLLTGVMLERDRKLTTIRLDWVVPAFWLLGLAGAAGLLNTVLRTGGNVGIGPLWAAGLGLSGAIALSASWFTRLMDAKRLAAQ